MARVLFVSGFNRSGTTLVTAALTRAARARTLTVGDLARHLPSLDRFLSEAGAGADRGVDRLAITPDTPEEYGWLLKAVTGEFHFDPGAERADVLPALVDELAGGGAETIVLKNPWDTGRERLLLDGFPGSCVLIVRRHLGAIEDSQRRAYERLAGSNRYTRALFADNRARAAFLAAVLTPRGRERQLRADSERMRAAAQRLAHEAATLPPERVAFLSYDELRADPAAGAAWAAHLVDPAALAGAVGERAFPEYHQAPAGDPQARAIDDAWARAWDAARDRQVRAGLLTAPARTR